VVLAVVLTWAVAPGWFTSWDPIATSPKDKLLPPGVEHWFGTDQIGRDVFARVVYGSRTTIQATVIAVGIGLVAGSVLGAVAGFLGGRTDSVVMRCVDVLLAIPNLLLAMVVVTALGFGSLNVAVAVGLSAVASFARVMRAEVVRVRASPYVEAAFAGGERTVQVLLRHILPNSWGPVLALSALEFGGAVLAVSALSFLGYGVVPPDPEWGSLIAEGRNWLASAWWLTTLPGLVVVVVVVSANHLGRSVGRWRGERA
jgi:peptide/nickel transport system permease protein